MIASGGCKGCGGDPADQFDRLPKYRLTYPDGSAQTAFTQAEAAAKVAAFAPYGVVEVAELVSKRGEPARYAKAATKQRQKNDGESTSPPE